MKRTLLTALAAVALVVGLFAAPAAAEPPTYSFTQDHAYCKGVFSDVGVHAWMRAYIRTQNDGTGHVVKSFHNRAWSNLGSCSGDGSAACGPNLNSPATENGRVRIYAVYADGSHSTVLDRSFNLSDANDCDYLAGTTSDWSINANEVHIRWDFDLKIETSSDSNGQSFMIARKVINGGADTWWCEYNGNLVSGASGDCSSAGPF